ncbi:hypothetical protein BAQ48_06785 [Bacillus luti]|uniref:hypothetical protein n=1 Tax=Bacillus luti TaxID=2026191 RepID=UPI0008FE003D|nr:hypothetical protein [Bacillus luti]OJE53043.1 hypothetical protein BAQ48_06785 [Bacillus luti]
MRWKEGTFEKIETNDASIEQLTNTFKKQNLNGGAVISCFKVHNENFFKEIPYGEDVWWEIIDLDKQETLYHVKG